MKKSVADEISEACAKAKARGLRLCRGGPWLTREGGKLTGVDPIVAVLLEQGNITEEDPIGPGRLAAACSYLQVNEFWLYRFWIGWDQDFQIRFTVLDKNKKETVVLDAVSQFGIALGRKYHDA